MCSHDACVFHFLANRNTRYHHYQNTVGILSPHDTLHEQHTGWKQDLMFDSYIMNLEGTRNLVPIGIDWGDAASCQTDCLILL
jgi:hypothetical protein